MNDLLFDVTEISTHKNADKKCKHCEHIRTKEYTYNNICYCAFIKCNRSQFGIKKIKANNIACKHFKNITNG